MVSGACSCAVKFVPIFADSRCGFVARKCLPDMLVKGDELVDIGLQRPHEKICVTAVFLHGLFMANMI